MKIIKNMNHNDKLYSKKKLIFKYIKMYYKYINKYFYNINICLLIIIYEYLF